MGGVAVQSNGQTQADHQLDYEAEYDKILALHDEIVAGRHPRLKITKKTRSLPTSSSLPLPPDTNGVSKPSTVVPTPSLNGLATSANSQVSPDVKSAAQQASSSAPVASDFDPILLTKGPALVREEMARKRRAIEQHLRDQYTHKKRFSRQKLLEEERLPDFNVTQVLERAHGIVKPIRFADGKNANRLASTSDSFDENDYYSSQMNSWTTDASPKRQPSSKEDDANDTQPMEIDTVDANEQASSRIPPLSEPAVKKKDEAAAQAARIAELEEQLRLATEKNAAMNRAETPPREEGLIEEPEYSPPDAPVAHTIQRQASVSSIDHDQSRETAPRRSSRPLPPQSREYAAARIESVPSPVQNDMRIVRNHITSPLAPQPARVSPLAVAKGPPGPHMRETQQNEGRGPRGAGVEKNGRSSPNQPIQPLTSRKRRRGKGSGEIGRNVIARRENNSPEVRIKEEPVSPQPRAIALEAWRPPRTEEVRRPVYVDTVSPQRRAADHAAATPRRSDRLAQQSFAGDPGRPLTPVERRNAQHAQLIEINDEPDLRRVVSTRQMYMPSAGSEVPGPYRASVQPHQTSQYYPEHAASPAPRNPQRVPSRVGSIAMAPPQPRIVVDQYGNRFVEAPAPPERQMSVVPIARPIDHEHLYEQPRRPIIIRKPSYEIGYDDRHYVQRAPSPSSPRYVQRVPSPTAARYVHRAPSPTSPRYVQRASSPVSPQYVQHPSSPLSSHFARPVNEMNERYAEEPYAPRGDHVRLVSQADNQGIARFEDFARPREPVTRLQSVRPVSQYEVPRMPSVRPGQDRVASMRPIPPPYEGPRIHSMQPEPERIRPMSSQYEVPREQYGRVQSVRPEQERIVNLGGRDMVQRQVSVRPEEIYVRPAGAVVEDRSRYSYIPESQDRRYVENDVLSNRVVYEAPGGGIRRPMQ